MSQQEVWKDYNGSIKQFHGLIRVSNMGRIFKKGTNTSKNQSGILKGTHSKQGYVKIHISINGKQYVKSVHRLVAEMFVPNPKNKPCIDHINAIRDDNRANNLRWVTQQENCHNPIYLTKRSQQAHDRLTEHNWLAEANKKKVTAENIETGEKLYFDSIYALKKYFHTKANIQRMLKNDRPVRSRKSKLYGWWVRLL